MKFKFLFSAIVFLWLNNINAQVVKVELSNAAFDEHSKKIQAIIPVYKFPKSPFEDPLLNGIKSKKQAASFNAKLPNLAGYKDTCYAYIFYGGIAQRRDLPGYVLAVLANNKRNEKPCIIWVDKNYNLDLTDDGAPDTLRYNDKFLNLTFSNPANTNAKYNVNISRYSQNFNTSYIGMLNSYYKENSGSKYFAGTDYSFKETRLNTQAGDFKLGNDSFRIALKDGNCNGLYNNEDVDFLLIGNYKSNETPELNIPLKNNVSKVFFEKNGKRYVVENIDELGKNITIKIDESAKLKNALVVGKKIKKFKFETSDTIKKKISIKKFKKKPTYIYVWKIDQENFTQDTIALRKIQNLYADKIHIVTLNYGEKPIIIKRIKARKKINWLIGFSTAKINQMLYVEKFPTGILTRKKLKVSKVGLSPTELLLLLQNNSL